MTITPKPIQFIAQQLNISPDFLLPFGHYTAKLDLALLKQNLPSTGKLILVSSITPTPLGEGKTVSTIGLSQALNAIGVSAIACLRQPSLGPVFGVKGGAAGGGQSQVIPIEKLNLHLTGDIHAVTAAHNLAAAAIDARLFHEQQLGEHFTSKTQLPRLNIDPNKIIWRRVMDHNDRALRHITVGLGGKSNGVEHDNGFDITAASELMAILALSDDLQDMRARIAKIILAYDKNNQPITAEQLEVAGAMSALLKEAIQPTLMQTTEHTPVLIHTGPFANIAHGNSSIIADRMAQQLASYVVTEAGFGSDMGMEKYFNIKYRQSKIAPSCILLVATIRSLKGNNQQFDILPGQPLPIELQESNLPLLREGSANLGWHITNAKQYGVPVIVTINRFPTDSDEELAFLQEYALSQGAFACEISDAFLYGGNGMKALAEQVIAACQIESQIQSLYPDDLPLKEKIERHAQAAYGAAHINFSDTAKAQLHDIERLSYDHLPLCFAKTPLSISADPTLKNVPVGFTVNINTLKICAGAGFICVYAGNIMTMPGLGSLPNYRHIDIDSGGNISGLA